MPQPRSFNKYKFKPKGVRKARGPYKRKFRTMSVEAQQRQTPRYKAWRLAVLNRDRQTCQMPDCGRKTHLQAHHIKEWAKHPGLRFVISNGITLCYWCHSRISKKEEEFAPLFTGIVARKRAALNKSTKESENAETEESDAEGDTNS